MEVDENNLTLYSNFMNDKITMITDKVNNLIAGMNKLFGSL